MNRYFLSACTLLLVLSLMSLAYAHADTYSGTWTMTPTSTPGQVQLELRYRHADATSNEEWDESRDVPAPQVRNNTFTISTDAGDFHAQGTFDGGQGGGTWTFVPNPNFPSQLRRRGLDAPTEKEQFELAMAGFKIATLDALVAAGFAKPSVGDLVRMIEHGVTADYVSAMKNLPFSSKTVDSLIRLRDHGVTAAFVQRMRSHGYTHLSADDLIRLRDHGF
jgi:hypothetical protein